LSDIDFYLHTQSSQNGTFQWHDIPQASDYIIRAYPPDNDNYATYQSEAFSVSQNCQMDIILTASLSISGKILSYHTNDPTPSLKNLFL
jgi:hypothetical protein